MEMYNSPAGAITFFILVKVITSFFLINAFVGVVVERYNLLKRENDGSAVLTESQRAWISTAKRSLAYSPEPILLPPRGRLRRALFGRCCFRHCCEVFDPC